MSGFRVEQIDHVELFVPDQHQAATWFERVFGLRLMPEYVHWVATGPLMLASATGDTKLALFRGEPREAAAQANFRRVAFRVTAAGMVEFLNRLGGLELHTENGRALRREDLVDHDGSLSIYFNDPWGHRFEITTYEVERFAQLGGQVADC